MRVLLINPWIYDFAAYDLWMRPMGLLYIAAVLKREGIDTDFIDCLDRYDPDLRMSPIKMPKDKKDGRGEFCKEEIEKPDLVKDVPRKYSRYGITEELFMEKLEKIKNPDCIFVTSMMLYWYPGTVRIIKIAKEKFPDSLIVLGGIYPTLAYNHSKKYTGADIVVKGQDINQVLDLLEENFPGFNRKYTYKSFKDYPFPYLSVYNHLAFIPLLTSLGCPYNCSFCASKLISPDFVQRDINPVFDELYFHYRKFKAKHLVFFDDALLVNKEKHINVLLERIIQKRLLLKIHTPNGIHPAHIDRETANLMKKAGFETVRLSLESVGKNRIRDIQGKVNTASFSSAVNFLEKAGFDRKKLECYIIMDLPGQKVEEVIETMIFAASNGVKIRLASYSPIPGTSDYEKSVKMGLLKEDTDPLLMNGSVFPLQRKDFTKKHFEDIKKIALMLNYSVDLEINIASNIEFINTLYRYGNFETIN